MGQLFQLLLRVFMPRRLLRPAVRFLVGALAIPAFRLFLRKVVRLQELDRELEKDLEQWFRGSLLLLVATANMEKALFGWVPLDLQGQYAWLAVGLRVMLAIGVIEAMPDQELFSVIHPGPPKLKWPKDNRLAYFRAQVRPVCRGLLCQHLNRSSPVFAILAAIFGGPAPVPGEPWQPHHYHWLIGWICYTLAITQYLIIGLVTSRDKALDALAEFDRRVAERRRELVEEFEVERPRPGASATSERAASPDAEGAVPRPAAESEKSA